MLIKSQSHILYVDILMFW